MNTTQRAVPMAPPRFTPKTLSFLRALKRHNDREWFRARRDEYEAHVRGPMVSFVERLREDFRTFVPELVADPRVSLYRIYRDTRFSEDKSPLKTHIAAVFPCRGLPKHQGAGLYFHVAPTEVWIGGGMYAPDTARLLSVREHIVSNHRRLRSIVEAPAFRRAVGRLDGERLKRVPRGFPADHPAADYLKLRQFLAGREYGGEVALEPGFYRRLVGIFRAVGPLVRFLNEPLRGAGE